MRAAFLIAAILAASPALAAGPFGKVSVGNWTGGAYTDDDTGKFSHCAVAASYRSGVTMYTAVTADMRWNIAFSSDEWTLTPGTNIPLKLVFDRRGSINAKAEVVAPTVVLVPLPDHSALVNAFRAAHLLEVTAKGERFFFALTGTARMLPALVDCVRENATLVMAPVKTQTGALPTAPSDDALSREALTLATNFLLASRMDDPQVLSKAETPIDFVRNGVAWRAAGAVGTVKIIEASAGQKGVDVAASIVAADAKECKGTFASGRTSELVDSEVLFRGFSSCEETTGVRYAEYYVVPRKKGGFAVFAVGTTHAAAQPSSVHQEKRSAFQKAALKASE